MSIHGLATGLLIGVGLATGLLIGVPLTMLVMGVLR